MLRRKWFLNDVRLSDVFIILLLWLNKSLIYHKFFQVSSLFSSVPLPPPEKTLYDSLSLCVCRRG